MGLYSSDARCRGKVVIVVVEGRGEVAMALRLEGRVVAPEKEIDRKLDKRRSYTLRRCLWCQVRSCRLCHL